MSITERDDVIAVEQDMGYNCHRVGQKEVTAIKIVKRHGVGDFMPYVEIWRGDQLFAEFAEHHATMVQFLPVIPDPEPTDEDIPF